MRIVWLVWYISGVLWLLAALSSLVTYHPAIQYLAVALPAAFGCGAVLVGAVAVGLGRLPPEHPVQRSRPAWALCVAAALMVTLLLVLAG